MYNENVFLLIPNNSGSTFIYKSICNSKNVSYLPIEGQFIEGFIGTIPSKHNKQFIWAGTDYICNISDKEQHDWECNKRVWAANMKNYNPTNVFVEKSPPNIAKVDMLIENFANIKFIISVRNPYAMFESILRARNKMPVSDSIIANHIINVLLIQKNNIESLDPNKFIFFTYEEMCKCPEKIANNIERFIPKLNDISFLERIKVKKRYDNVAYDYNSEQISRLKKHSIDTFNNELHKCGVNIMSFFNYELL